MKALAILAGLIASIQVTLAGEAVPRLGILSDAGSRQEADLLLVELQKAKCELVERDEIRRVVSEQALQAGLNRTESVRVGQMLKADGLVLLTTPTNNVVSVRFVAVAPGVVIWCAELQSTVKDKEAPPLPVTLAHTLARYLPKLSVQKQAAIPVSLMRVRPAIGTAQAAQLANEAHSLLLLRLVHEPALFVLERENLKQMDEEQRWAGKDAGFWTGSCLVEATASHDLVETNRVTLTLTVRPPMQGKQRVGEVTLQEKGRRSELPVLVNRLAGQLVAQLAATPSKAPWDVAQEGLQFAALGHRLRDPAQRKNAYETAMTLGCRDRKTLLAYLQALKDWSAGPNDFNDTRQLHQTAERLIEMLEFCQNYRPPEGFTVESEQWWLAMCISAYSETTALSCAGRFLEKLHESGRAAELGDQLGRLRAECRKLANRFWLNDAFLDSSRDGLWPMTYVPFFYDTTREILQIYRKQALPHCAFAGVPLVVYKQQFLVNVADKVPAFPSAATESPETSAALWAAYRRDLAAPTTPAFRLGYWLDKMARTNTPQSLFIARRGLQSQLLQDKDYAVTQTNLWPMVTAAFSRDPVRLPGAEETWEHERAVNMFISLCGHERVRDDDLLKIGIPYLIEPHRSYINWGPQQLLDSVKRPALAQELNRLFARPAAQTFRQPPLVVTRTAQMRCGGDVRGVTDAPRWAQQKLWRRAGHYLIEFDPAAGRCQSVPLPGFAADYVVTADYLVCWGNDSLASTNQAAFTVGYRPRAATQWRTVSLTAPVTSCVALGGKLYLSIQVPGTGYARLNGVVALDPASGRREILRAPDHQPSKTKLPKDAVPPFEDVLFGESLLTTTNELVGTYNRQPFGWNPVTKAIRPIPKEELAALTSASDPYRHASRQFGFDIQLLNRRAFFTEGEKLYLSVTRTGQKDSERVTISIDPLRPAKSPYPDEAQGRLQFALAASTRASYFTANSLLLFGESDYWEIPYVEIQQWLAAHPLVSDLAGGSNGTSTVTAPSAPTRAVATVTIADSNPPARVAEQLIAPDHIPQKIATARTVVVALVDDYSKQARAGYEITPALVLDDFLYDLRASGLPRPAAGQANTVALYIAECGPQTRQRAADLFAAHRASVPYDNTIPVLLVFRQGKLVKTFTYRDRPPRPCDGVQLWQVINDHLIAP